MDTSPIVSMDALWPELTGQRRAFEVLVTLRLETGGEPFVSRALPPEVFGCWSADQVVATVTVLTSRPSGAVAAAEALVPEPRPGPRGQSSQCGLSRQSASNPRVSLSLRSPGSGAQPTRPGSCRSAIMTWVTASAASSTAEKYRNRDGHQQTSVDFDGRITTLQV